MAKQPKIVKMQEVKPRALSVKDAAEYMGLAPKTLRNRLGSRARDPFPVKPRYYGGKMNKDRAAAKKRSAEAGARNLEEWKKEKPLWRSFVAWRIQQSR